MGESKATIAKHATRPILGVVAAGMVLSACGGGADDGSADAAGTTGATSKRLSGQSPCELVTASVLKDVTGMPFDNGELEGPQCSFSPHEGPIPVGMVGIGVQTAGNGASTRRVDVGGVAATQGGTEGGDLCTVDVPLVDGDKDQTYSATISGSASEGDPCGWAKGIATHILEGLPE